MLLAGTNSDTGAMTTQSFIVRAIDVQSSLNRTRVEFTDGPATPSFVPASLPPEVVKEEKIPFSHSAVRTHILEKTIGESDLQAFLHMNVWSAADLMTMVNNPRSEALGSDGAFAFAQRRLLRAQCAGLEEPARSFEVAARGPVSRSVGMAPITIAALPFGPTRRAISTSDASVFLERSFPATSMRKLGTCSKASAPAGCLSGDGHCGKIALRLRHERQIHWLDRELFAGCCAVRFFRRIVHR